MLTSFSPIVDYQSTVLIVGSMPSVKSFEKNEYYGFPQNRFWKIMSAYSDISFQGYKDKLRFLKQSKIALWDIIASCERTGSLDCHIKQVKPNAIDSLVQQYPALQVVICNGKKSEMLYKKYFSHLSIKMIALPSTSNANTSVPYESLLSCWTKTLQCELGLFPKK